MTNGRNSRGIWLRDWSAIASNRAARWTRRVTPALGSVARRAARPTLRLFGAGRKPGPAMATALPRQEPLVLRMKRPERPVGTPFLTVQSNVAFDVDEAPVAPPQPETEAQETAGPGPVSASTPRVLRQPEHTPPSQEPPTRVEPASVVGRISRAVQQVLRRATPRAAPPSGEITGAVAGSEDTPETSAPSASVPQAEPDSRALRASAAAYPGPTIARAATPEEEPEEEEPEEEVDAPEPHKGRPELTLRRRAEAPAAPSYVARAVETEEEPVEVESTGPQPMLQRSPGPDADGGLLLSLRRVFWPKASQQSAEVETSLESRAEGPAVAASPPAPSIAREVTPRMDEPRAVTAAEPSVRAHPAEAREPTPLPEEGAAAGAPALRRSVGEAHRQDGGLLFTLRRLVLPQPESEAKPDAERATEAPATSAPLGYTPEPAGRVASPEPAASPSVPLASQEERAQPALEASMEEVEPEGTAMPTFRATEYPEMTLRRSRAAPDATEGPETASFDEAHTSGAVPAPLGDPAAEVPPSRAAESEGRLPRILRLWRRPERPRQDDLNLTLARPAAALPATAAAASVQRTTYNAETGRTEVMEEGAETQQLEASTSALARAPSAAAPASTLLRRASRPSAAPAQAPARSDAPLVYRARQAADGPLPAALQALTPGSMTTLEVGAATVAEIRRATSKGDTTMIARAEGDAAPPSTPGQAPGEAPAPEGAGPAASIVAQESNEETQVSLETLARKVYDRLRARMLIERERAGFGVGMISR